MSLLRRPAPDDVDDDSPEALHALAQQKVQAAIAGLGGGRAVGDALEECPGAVGALEDADPVVAAALERLSACAPELMAEGPDGQAVSRVDLVRAVLGPLAGRNRDADTTAALLQALEAPAPSAEALIHQQMLLEGGLERHVFRAEGAGVRRPA